MTIYQRFRLAYQQFLASGKEQFPLTGFPETGRSSVEPNNTALSVFNNKYGYINPIFDIELINAISKLALYNPDFSQFIRNLISLGNQGHKINVVARDDSQVTNVIERINDRAADLYANGGVDGLLNQYGRQLAEKGAVSSEDVVDIAGRQVRKVVIVPVDQIRFRYNPETDDFDALQLAVNYLGAKGNLVDLNKLTYAYFPWCVPENSPYAIPPGLAAVETIINSQSVILDSIPDITNRKRILGLISVLINPPRTMANESESETTARANRLLAAWKAALSGNISQGLLIAFKGTQVQHTQTSGDSQGFNELHQISEDQVFSGLNMPSWLANRAGGITDSFAKVVWEAYKADTRNVWKPAKRRHERTLRLDCNLAGLNFDSISLNFNRMPSLNPNHDAQAERNQVDTVLIKIRAGFISPDDGAMELGYESCFDATLMFDNPELAKQLQSIKGKESNSKFVSAAAIYNPETNRYRIQREQLTLAEEKFQPRDNVIDLVKKKTSVLN